MFGCLPLDGPHREGGLLAGLRTYLPLRRTTLTQQLFGPRPKFRRPYPSGIANSARLRRSPKGRARWTCGCWRTGSWSITYFILCRSSRDCLKTLRRSRAKGCTPLDPQRFSGPCENCRKFRLPGKPEASLKIGKARLLCMGLFFKNPMFPHPLRRKRGAESGLLITTEAMVAELPKRTSGSLELLGWNGATWGRSAFSARRNDQQLPNSTTTTPAAGPIYQINRAPTMAIRQRNGLRQD